mgnify:CR=1 FL=1
MADTVTAYKAFDNAWKCRDFQYEVGKTYKHSGKARLCNSGFHACLVPFDCWGYYPGSKNLGGVTMEDVSAEREEDSKICGAKITIDLAFTLPEWIKEQVKVVIGLAKDTLAKKAKECAAATGDSGHAAATGDRGHAAATGYSGHAAATGNYGHAAATGNYGHAAATGDRGHAAATGYSGHAAATGNYGHAAATGDSSIAASLGIEGTAMGGENSWLTLAEWKWSDKTDRWELLRVKSAKVGADGVKPNVRYQLKRGKFIAVKE